MSPEMLTDSPTRCASLHSSGAFPIHDGITHGRSVLVLVVSNERDRDGLENCPPVGGGRDGGRVGNFAHLESAKGVVAMVKQIPLTKGHFALVDDEDFEMISAFKWHSHGRKQHCYARRCAQRNGKQVKIYLHRSIIEVPSGMCIDHINGDELDCRRENLRVATFQQNCQNRARRADASVLFKGVRRKGEKYVAYINGYKNWTYLGSFETAVDAAVAYDAAARLLYGEFARTNFGY